MYCWHTWYQDVVYKDDIFRWWHRVVQEEKKIHDGFHTFSPCVSDSARVELVHLVVVKENEVAVAMKADPSF